MRIARKRRPNKMFQCQECGRKFKTAKAAQRASYSGCPNCGSTDIDLMDILNDPEYLKTLVAD